MKLTTFARHSLEQGVVAHAEVLIRDGFMPQLGQPVRLETLRESLLHYALREEMRIEAQKWNREQLAKLLHPTDKD